MIYAPKQPLTGTWYRPQREGWYWRYRDARGVLWLWNPYRPANVGPWRVSHVDVYRLAGDFVVSPPPPELDPDVQVAPGL